MNPVLAEIARRMGVPTLETRRSDRLDFHEVAVWELKEALEAAYAAGWEAATRDRSGGAPEPAPDPPAP